MKTRIASTRSLLLLALACGPREPDEQPAPAPESESDTELIGPMGGMDGAGLYPFGLTSAENVFVQPVWQEQRLTYLVVNDRPQDVEIMVAEVVSGPEGAPLDGQRVAGPWRVPSGSVQSFSADDIAALPPSISRLGFRLDDGTDLGQAYRPSEPRWPSTLPVVSTLGSNGVGSEQVETDFAAAPGRTFTISLALPPGGDLTLWSKGTDAPAVAPVVDVVAVRSERGTVRSTRTGFVVDIPGTSDFERSRPSLPTEAPDGGPDAAPARVEVDVAIPAGVGGSSVLFHAERCFMGRQDNGKCRGSRQANRVFPLSE